MTQHDIIDKIHEIRQLVEEVHDISFTVVKNTNIIERTEDGKKLARVLFGLDIIRKGIKDSETRNR